MKKPFPVLCAGCEDPTGKLETFESAYTQLSKTYLHTNATTFSTGKVFSRGYKVQHKVAPAAAATAMKEWFA